MQPKKIAIYSGSIPSTTFIERLIIGLANDGLPIYLFGYQTGKIQYPKNVFLYSYSNKLDKFWILLKYSILLQLFRASDKKKLDKIIAHKKYNSINNKIKYYPVLYQKPDIFHLQWAKSIEDWIWVQEFGIKIVVSLRGAHINYTPILNPEFAIVYQNLFPKIDAFHAVSIEIAKEAVKYNADSSKIKVVYSGLDLEKINFNYKNETDSKPFKIISIGRNHWKKGYDFAIDACDILHQQKFGFSYTIIGVGNDEELLFHRNQLEQESVIMFKKSMPFQSVLQEISQATILLLPSVEEGIANVVLEAMAIGTIVLTTNCGGMNEVIVDGENGFIVPSRSPKSIAEKIIKITNLSESQKQTIRKNARKTIESQFTSIKMVSEMKALYDTVFEI